MMTKGWRTKGFTLIELLVVIAIIAVLAAILWPVMAGVQEKGRQAKCTAHILQLNTALGAYKADWGRYPFAPWYDGTLGIYHGGGSALYPDYVSNKDNLLCPDDSTARNPNRPANYCSYNGQVAATGPSSAPAYWAFGTTNDDEEDASNVGPHRMVTYNYYGFTNSGWEDTYWDGSSWVPTRDVTAAPPAWLTNQGLKSRHDPRLINPRAPDNTITFHCIHHRDWYGSAPSKWRDIYVRRGGEGGTCSVSQWSHKRHTAPPPSASTWKMQQ